MNYFTHTCWLESRVTSILRLSLPVPTFASFLKEVDSPYEVHDYVRAYLGDTPEAKDFAKQFLERRAKQNANQQKPTPQNQQQALKQQQVSQLKLMRAVPKQLVQSTTQTFHSSSYFSYPQSCLIMRTDRDVLPFTSQK